MKRHRYALLGLTGVVAALALPASSSAEVIANERTPIGGQGFNFCAGEPIVFAGSRHDVQHEDGFHIILHFKEVDRDRDGQVVNNSVVNVNNHFDGKGAIVLTAVNRDVQNDTGRSRPGDDFSHKLTSQVVITPNGNIVVERTNQEIDCR